MKKVEKKESKRMRAAAAAKRWLKTFQEVSPALRKNLIKPRLYVCDFSGQHVLPRRQKHIFSRPGPKKGIRRPLCSFLIRWQKGNNNARFIFGEQDNRLNFFSQVQTKIIYNNANPIWNQELRIGLKVMTLRIIC